MNKSCVDFKTLAAQVVDPQQQWGEDKLAIWGGACDVTDVLTLLEKWPQRVDWWRCCWTWVLKLLGKSTQCDVTMPYRIWQYVDHIVCEEKTLPERMDWLERGRLFGPGGDLTIRRDGERFYWHFVGRPDIQPPQGHFGSENFWEQAGEAGATFMCREQHALLWGERQAGFDLWFDERAGRATLRYPLDETGRVRIKYQTFSRAGRVEFVWLLKWEACHG
jgi:hypothetical protein